MATRHVILTGTVNWCRPWPNQIDREYEDIENGKGGNWSTEFIPDEDSVKVYNALGCKAKLRDGKIRLRRYERHPALGELGPVEVKGVDEGTAIGNGSKVAVGIDVYDYTFKGKDSRAVRWVGLDVLELVEYKKPDVSKPAVGVPVV